MMALEDDRKPKRPRAWLPPFFSELARASVETGKEAILKKHSLILKEEANGKYVLGFVNAASKWRVANSISGFRAQILPKASSRGATIPEDQISQKLCDSYSAQMKVSLAVFAFEAYARCFGRDWQVDRFPTK